MSLLRLKQQITDVADQPMIAGLAVVVMVLLTSFLLISNIKTLWFGHSSNPVTAISNGYQAPAASSIPGMHLFGASASDLSDLPLASLGLQVEGIFLSQDAQQSRALISMTGQMPQRYNVGSMLPGNVKIYKITHNSVIVSHNNQLEKLPFALQGIDFNAMGHDGGLFG